MSAGEYHESTERGIARHAEEQVARGLWSSERATEEARAEFARLLPQGAETPGFSFEKVLDEATGHAVGETWSYSRVVGGRPQFWVHWVGIDPPYRGQGFGKATLRALEERARAAGADRIGLNVFADNVVALELYRKLGFEATSVRMAKRL